MNSPGERVLVNVGCGPPDVSRLPPLFEQWSQLRVDSDPAVQPDLIADLTDLSKIRSGSADAVWASHCVEHLYQHQVQDALREFRRILRKDGFLCVIVPDLQAIAQIIAADRALDPVYRSAAGPVSAHDMVYGFGAAIARGNTLMAHRCGFTPGILSHCFEGLGFGEVVLRRREPQIELAALARTIPSRDDAERAELMAALEL